MPRRSQRPPVTYPQDTGGSYQFDENYDSSAQPYNSETAGAWPPYSYTDAPVAGSAYSAAPYSTLSYTNASTTGLSVEDPNSIS